MNSNDLLPSQIELEEECDPLLLASLDCEETARLLDLEQWIASRLHHPRRELTVSLPLVHEGGECAMITGYRVQHHLGAGPTLGPISISPHANLRALKAAAMQMTWQLALLQLPFGGAAGAIVADPEHLSERDLKTLAAEYAVALNGMAGAYRDILTPGSGCNPQTMAWMLTPGSESDPRALAAVTGKPAALWGLAGQQRATALGVASVLQSMLRDLKGCRIAVQGFGALGSSIADVLQQEGASIIAIADVSGGLTNPDGIDVAALTAHVEHHGVIFGYPDAEAVCNADVLEGECDVLVLAAAERQITPMNAGRVRAHVVIEATPAALTRRAEELLRPRGITVVPQVIATAGAAIAASLEWTANTQIASAAPDVNAVVPARVATLYREVRAMAEQQQLTLRQAALALAAERVAAQMRLKGM